MLSKHRIYKPNLIKEVFSFFAKGLWKLGKSFTLFAKELTNPALRNVLRHGFCIKAGLAHCRPRSCGRQRAKPNLQTKTRATKHYPNKKEKQKTPLLSQKLNLATAQCRQNKSLHRDSFADNKNAQSTVDTVSEDRTTACNSTLW